MTTPVRYGEHAPATPGTTCLLCGLSELKMVADHCHGHGWVRGILCCSCNALMVFIDRRMAVRESALKGRLTLAALVAHAARCPDCEPFGIEDLSTARKPRSAAAAAGALTGNGKATLLLRVPRPFKARLAAYARARGLTLNAAATVLLDEALDKTSD